MVNPGLYQQHFWSHSIRLFQRNVRQRFFDLTVYLMSTWEPKQQAGYHSERIVDLAECHMYSCAGTNKSQCIYGELGLVVANRRFDFIRVLYMVVCNTTFVLDLVARFIPGKYNIEATLNQAVLHKHIGLTTVAAYDATLLQIWRIASPLHFSEHLWDNELLIFFIIADDKAFLQNPLNFQAT